jgi:hypothetical protein
MPALTRSEYPEVYHSNAAVGRPYHENAILTTLYVRHGLLVFFSDRNPDKEEAPRLLKGFRDRLPEWEDDYKERVASAVDVKGPEAKFADADPCLNWQGDAYVLDCRRLTIPHSGTVFETRLCLAICTGTASSKIWSRVSLPMDSPDVSSRVRVDEVPSLCPWFRAIAESSIIWGFDKLRAILPSYLPGRELHVKATVKATSMGILDDVLRPPFEQLRKEGAKARDLLMADTAFDTTLTSYCQKVSSIDDGKTLSHCGEAPNMGGYVWFKMPLCAVLTDGEVVDRVVLYLMRGIKGYIEVVGLAYDDSERGDLVFRSGAALSKVIGPWI